VNVNCWQLDDDVGNDAAESDLRTDNEDKVSGT
jgi:hypothetical protein